ncbi:MAG: threonylcarbamoyl-AMP synthase [Candidatus Heimdallarchaeota archaeon]|nr:threonylcarbamoyl-AMP synthase [Candidatus Heimdallarchaeota archaeon]
MIIKIDDPHLIDRAVSLFRRGAVVVFPTDTVYGLGTIATEENKNIERIFRIKKRSFSKPLSVLMTMNMLHKYIEAPDEVFTALSKIWPARITFILNQNQNSIIKLSNSLNTSGNNTIACRVPVHNILLQILHGIDVPIIGTSANVSGTTSSYDFTTVYNKLYSEEIDLWINQGKLPQHSPSTLVDFTDHQNPIILRQGDYNFSEFWKDYLFQD